MKTTWTLSWAVCSLMFFGFATTLTSCGGNTQKASDNNLPTDLRLLAGEQLAWNDEFNGDSLNSAWWGHETDIHVNGELQTYVPEQSVVGNGVLTITAIKMDDNQQYGSYQSGRVYSKGKKEFKYGRMEIRAKLPAGRGTWPALWMLGGNIDAVDWPACGEIDIMEHVGYDPGVINTAIHNNSSCGATINVAQVNNPTFDSEFHIYGMSWDSTKMDFYLDDPSNIYYTYAPAEKDGDNWPFDQPCFFILNLAIGGHWGGKEGIDDTIFPVSMEVDYVRVYQKAK